MIKERNEYFDFLKGVAILMVIGIHTFIKCDFSSFHNFFNIGVRQVLNCAVPFFLACSGYFLASKTLNNRNDIIGFYQKQIIRVYLPCLLWSLPWMFFHIWGGHGIIMGIINLIFCGFSVFYFVILIIQYYLLLPVIQRFLGKKLLCVSIICSLLCVASVMYLTAINGIRIPLTVYAGPFPLWIVFFVMGVFLAKNDRNYQLGYIIIGLIIGLILQIWEARWLYSYSNHIGLGIKPTAFIFSFFAVLLAFSSKMEKTFNHRLIFNKIISHLGKVSFIIYLSHSLLIVIISRIPIYNNLIWFMRFFVVAVFDIVFVAFLYRFIPNKIKRLVGF